ncbi:hypothetical protein [Allocoleopsis sp.]|uniref:hypothetical protein n=1 Tax=Allocoleopsis sp. TaxID=3088169 RepID=UPI002FD18659
MKRKAYSRFSSRGGAEKVGFYAGHANRITIGVMVWGKFKAQRRLVSESAILQMALIKALE